MPDDGRESLFLAGSTRVKICGVTNPTDAGLVVDAGADALGVNLFPGSKRFVELADAAAWLSEIPVTRVAVVVNPTVRLIEEVADSGCFDAVQFHGDETPEFCAGKFPRWMRAVRVSGWPALEAALAYETPWLLLDAFSESGYGGTGEAPDLQLVADFVRAHSDRRVIVAGGLRPESVAEAIRITQAHGVDVASGVEQEGNPRKKDGGKVREFVAAAREGRVKGPGAG